MKRFLFILLIVGMLIIAACGAEPTPMPTGFRLAHMDNSRIRTLATPASDAFESPIGLPNPASKFCEDSGYILELRTDANGTAGYCIFPDGSECEEWAFFRGECAPGTPTP